MNTKYAIKLADGKNGHNYWYDGHGGRAGCGCLRSEYSLFPPRLYDTQEEASKVIDEIVRDFPNDGVHASIICLIWKMKEVFD